MISGLVEVRNNHSSSGRVTKGPEIRDSCIPDRSQDISYRNELHPQRISPTCLSVRPIRGLQSDQRKIEILPCLELRIDYTGSITGKPHLNFQRPWGDIF